MAVTRIRMAHITADCRHLLLDNIKTENSSSVAHRQRSLLSTIASCEMRTNAYIIIIVYYAKWQHRKNTIIYTRYRRVKVYIVYKLHVTLMQRRDAIEEECIRAADDSGDSVVYKTTSAEMRHQPSTDERAADHNSSRHSNGIQQSTFAHL